MAATDAGLVARIERVCSRDADGLTLRLRLLDELRRVVSFDAHAWLLTDPETWVGTAPLANVPPALLPQLPRLIRLKYLTTVNRWTTLRDSPVARLYDATGGDPARSLLWRELLGPHGFGDVASVVFADRYGCWGFLELWRSGRDARFRASEAAQLARVSPAITGGLRRSQAATFDVETAPTSVPAPGPVVLLLSADLDVRAQTVQTQQYLRLLVPTSDDLPPIPASAYNVAAQLLALEAGVDSHVPSARVHLANGRWVTLRAARTDAPTDRSDPDPSRRDIAVTIEVTTPTDRCAVFARAHALGTREREVLDHLVAGHDTRSIARDMAVSEHTVLDHVKSTFAKTATNTRAALVSRAVGA